MNVNPENYKKVVKELKEKNELVYTIRGKVRRASKVNFLLYKNVEGGYVLVATVK